MELLPPTLDPFPIHHEASLTSERSTQYGVERRPIHAQQIRTPQQHELWSKTITLSRGRVSGDPHARILNSHCQNVEDLRTGLCNHLASPNPDSTPEHTTIDFIFPISAAFLVADPFASIRTGSKLAQAPQALIPLHGTPNTTVISLMEAMTPMPDPKDNMKKQRVIAKACVEAVQRADGHRYSFHNNWWSKEDEANRFSYFCNDSILNKGRSANGGASTVGQKVQKPVYDCKGIIAVKFSAVKQNLQVQYKHLPVHKSYEERAPPPRRGTNRYKLAELYNPESLLRQRNSQLPKAADPGKRKRKRQTSDQTSPDRLDEALTPNSIQSLGSTRPVADRPRAPSRSNRGLRGQHEEKTRCSMCKSKKVKCDGKVPCSGCADRPVFCTYPDETIANGPSCVGRIEARLAAIQRESGPTPTDTTAGAMPSWGAKAAAAAKTTGRDVQKELGEAMSEFDVLKAKLAVAEERVRQLEAEKESES